MRSIKLTLSIVAVFTTAIVIYNISSNVSKKQHYQVRTLTDQIHAQGINGAIQWLNMMKANQVTGEISIKDILMARHEMLRFAQQNTNKNLGMIWNEMGPDNVAGRVRAFLIDKNNSNKLYVGGVSGGLWVSNTGGNTWNRITSISDNIAISSIAQSPNGVIYVGTGEGLAQPGATNFNTGQIGNGMYKSTDGINFTSITSTVPDYTSYDDNTDWCIINRIACSPNSERVWVATNKGLKYSDDEGATWTNAKQNTGTNTINLSGYGSDIKIASNGKVFYSQFVSSGGGRAGKLFISADGDANNFVQKTNGTILPNDMGRVEIAVSPSDPNYVYLCCATQAGALYNIYQSTDGGDTYRIVGPGGSANLNIFGSNNQGWYDNVIAVFPNNPNKIIVGGIDSWIGEQISPTMPFSWAQKSLWYADDDVSEDNDIFYVHADHHVYQFLPNNPNTIFMGTDGGLFKSIDGGNTFIQLNRGLNITQFYSVACANNHRVMGGTQDNGTQYISLRGNTPQNAKSVQGGDGGFSAFSIINSKVLFTSVYNGNARRSPDEGENYEDVDKFYAKKMLNTDGSAPAFTAAFVTPIYHWESINDVFTPDSITFIADKNYVAGELIRGKSKNNRYPIRHILTNDLNMGDSIKLQDIAQSKFYLGISGGVWMTRQALVFGKTPLWLNIAAIDGMVSTMSSCKDGNHLFVGTYSGNVYRISGLKYYSDSIHLDVASSQYALTVTKIANYPNRTITSVSANWYDPDKVVVTLGNFGNQTSYIYYSDDATADVPTFVSKQGNLPKIPVYSSLIEMNHKKYVVIGTEYGMFTTEDITAANPTWVEENQGIGGRVPVFMIRQQSNFANADTGVAIDPDGNYVLTLFPGVTNSGFIYIGTHGRGIFYNSNFFYPAESIRDNTAISESFMRIFPNPANEYTNVSFAIQSTDNVRIRIFDLKGTIIRDIDMGTLNIGQYQQHIDCSDLSVGTYIVNVRGNKTNFSSKFIIHK